MLSEIEIAYVLLKNKINPHKTDDSGVDRNTVIEVLEWVLEVNNDVEKNKMNKLIKIVGDKSWESINKWQEKINRLKGEIEND